MKNMKKIWTSVLIEEVESSRQKIRVYFIFIYLFLDAIIKDFLKIQDIQRISVYSASRV